MTDSNENPRHETHNCAAEPSRTDAERGTTTEEGQGCSYAVVIVAAVFWIYFCIFMQYSAFSVMYLEYVDHFEVSRSIIGIVAAVYSVGSTFTGALCSGLMQYMQPRIVAMGGAVLAGIASYMISQANSVPFMAFAYVLTGLGSSLTFLSASSVVQQYFGAKRTLATAITFSGMSLASLVSPPLVRLVTAHQGWRAAMMMVACIKVQCVWLCAFLRPKPGMNIARSKSSANCFEAVAKTFSLQLLTKPPFLLFSLATVLSNISLSAFMQHIFNLAVDAGVSKDIASSIPAINGVVSLISRLVFGFITSSVDLDKSIWFALGLLGISGCLFALPLVQLYVYILVISTLNIVASGLVVVVQHPLMVDLVGIQHVFGAMGIFMVSTGIGQMAGPPLAGKMHDDTHSYTLCFAVMAAITGIAAFLVLLILWINRQRGNASAEHGQAAESLRGNETPREEIGEKIDGQVG